MKHDEVKEFRKKFNQASRLKIRRHILKKGRFTDCCKAIGISNSQLSAFLSGTTYPSKKIISQILLYAYQKDTACE